MHTREEKLAAFGRLLDVMDELREKCPWDRKQTNESLRPNTIEETYELADAIIKDDKMDICKELGDVLLHIVFYAKIGSETGDFDIADVCDKLCDKLIYRHPHVFGPEAERIEKGEITVDEVLKNWEQLKVQEKGGNKRVLSGVPDALPSLIKAYRIQDKARGVGFDWEEKQQVWDKVKEEQLECEDELKAMEAARDEAALAAARDRAEEEMGDYLFAVVNAARLYGIDPDKALHRACDKFRRRFTYLEEHTIRQGRDLHDMTLAEMDAIWDEGKAKGL
jgi:XTP/dITP diphosphohydrolase